MPRHKQACSDARSWVDDLRVADRVTAGVQQAMIAWLRPASGADVLDAGCGAGGFTALLAEVIGPEGAVVALDEDPAALDATRATLTEHGVVDRVELLSSDILDTGLQPASFDLVCARSMIHHLPDQLAGMQALVRLARRGGTVALGEDGLALRCLPFDIGVGEPGLEHRLLVAGDRWFAAMRRALPDGLPWPHGWRRLLIDAGLADVKARSFLFEAASPLRADQLSFATSWLGGMLHEDRIGFVDPDDRATLARLLDPNDEAWIGRRTDLHILSAYTLHTATVADPGEASRR